MKKIFLTLLLAFYPSNAFAFTEENIESTSITASELFEAPALNFDLPKPLLLAVSKVESGLKPWVLNIEGQGFRFDSKKEALVKAQEAWEAGQSFDVGLMQINNWWLKRYGIPLEAALDPAANVYFGAWILKEELTRHGDLKKAIGAYHSPNPARANNYANIVMAALERGPQPSAKKVKALATATQDVVPKKPQKIQDAPKMLIPAPEKNAPAAMLVMSKNKVMATQNSMKLENTNPQISMKIEVKK